MKRLLTIILILVLILPATTIAEKDPVVGSWYLLFDKSEYPEMASTFGDADVAFSIYWFTENGTIMSTELSVIGDNGTANYVTAGRWVKEDSGYKYSIIGFGEDKAVVEGDNMFLSIPDTEGLYMMMRRMVPFNPYKDYIRK